MHPSPAPSRRQFLASSAALAGSGLAAGLGGPACARQARSGAVDGSLEGSLELGDGPLEAAYQRLHARLPRACIQRSNHAPMVVEALHALGRADAIGPWLAENIGPYTPEEEARGLVTEESWREHLGRVETFSEWRAFFLGELERDDWRAVLLRWGPRLAPGLSASVAHGVIRAGHAARAIAQRDSPLCRAEFASGLAYWASSYLELPWDGSVAPERSVADALARLPLRRPALPVPRGSMLAGLGALAETPAFQSVAGWVDVRDPSRTLSEISAAFARVYLRQPSVGFAHLVTGPAALRSLVPHLDEEGAQAATRHAWQLAAGLYVVYGDPGAPEPELRPAPREALVAACVANGAAHSIKLTEACLREDALSGDPILLAAARVAGENLRG